MLISLVFFKCIRNTSFYVAVFQFRHQPMLFHPSFLESALFQGVSFIELNNS